ncbi:MAG TPA: hypothetical protein VE553_06970, partial [Candidatus Binatia bacterium]|nr:hypothetical protein [Candidatus Binatia bacterium]
MQTKIRFSVFLVAMLAFVLVLVASDTAFAVQAPVDPDPIDLPQEVRDWKPTAAHLRAPGPLTLARAEAAGEAAAEQLDCVMDSKMFLALDNYNGFYFFTTFLLVAEGDGAQIWVQEDLTWPAGDPRETPEVTCEQAEYLLGEFENNIYPTEINFFGEPDFHDGTNSLLVQLGYVPEGYYDDTAGSQVILVANVRDENYYDPDYPLYIAGFYSSTLEAYFDRNTMTI